MPPPLNVGGHIDLPLSVRPSVLPSFLPSVPKVCPEHISETIGTRVMKLHMLIELDERKCSDQEL